MSAGTQTTNESSGARRVALSRSLKAKKNKVFYWHVLAEKVPCGRLSLQWPAATGHSWQLATALTTQV